MSVPQYKLQKLLLVLAVVGSVMLWGTQRANALTLVPPSLEFSTQPGKTIDTLIKLYNEGSDPISVYMSTALFTAKDETGTPDFTFNAQPSDIATWIKAPAGPLGIQAGERIEVPVTIEIPATAEPGGHFAGLFFETRPPDNAPGQVKVRQKIGTLVILRIDGDIQESATVEKFAVDNIGALHRLPVAFVTKVHNTGNVHVRPTGTIQIKNMFGKVVSTLAINESEGAVLPNSTRRFDAMWHTQTVDETRGSFTAELGREWHNFAFGKYTATFAGTYGATKQTLAATTTFTVWPWELLLVFGVGLIVVVVLLILFIKWYNGMIIRRAQAGMMQQNRKP